MSKKTEETQTDEQAKEILAEKDAVRPVAGQTTKPVDAETLSHNWQAGSPAIDTNVLSDHPNLQLQKNAKDLADTEENIQKREESDKIAADQAAQLQANGDDKDPSQRDVSDPLYANPGSERHQAWLDKQGK